VSPSPAERLRQTRRLLRAEGVGGVTDRLRLRLADRLTPAPGPAAFPVAREDLDRAAAIAASGERPPGPLPWRDGEPLEVAWVCKPPGEGSGGHTTMFRMVAALEAAGHRCTVYLYDRHGWELDQHRRTIRSWWPWVGAEVRDAAAGIADAHVVMATSWDTAYPVLASPAKGARCYFVQDFEPSFYPTGSLALLAEETYRWGFQGVTAGCWLDAMLERKYGMPADHFDFGCDLDAYAGTGAERREGVCYFCRPSTPRRAHELAVAGLERFAQRHPESPIHTFGESPGHLPFPVVDHGLMTPQQLGELYRSCVAGLILSATNVSLVPHEMLAAGCIPVVNEAEHNRVVLANDQVAYTRPTPFDIGETLSRLVSPPAEHREATATTAVHSVGTTSWDRAGAQVERILRTTVQAQQPSPIPA
jgi:O-antigen biosynthesis protein